jgi:hypothetical protein
MANDAWYYCSACVYIVRVRPGITSHLFFKGKIDEVRVFNMPSILSFMKNFKTALW